MRLHRALVWGGAFSLLSACSLYPAQAPVPRLFDFGPPHGPTYHGPTLPPLSFAGFEAAAGVGGHGIHYRLLYRHPYELRRYPGAIWLATPTRLMSARLQSRIDALSRPGTVHYLLALTLTACEEDFTSPTSGTDRMVVDATLTRPLDQNWRVHHVFTFPRAARPGAAGAVAGFTSLAHTFDRALTAWIARKTR